MFRAASMISVVVAFAACVDRPGQDAQEATAVQEVTSDCQSDGICPKNSPVIATFPFHELSLHVGEANTQGFAIERFMIGGLVHDLHVVNGHISGQLGNNPPVTGSGLRGAQLWIRKGTVEYILRITDYRTVNMWATLPPPQPPQQIEAYQIDWTDVVNHQPLTQWHNVCAEAMLPGGGVDMRGVPSDVTLTFVFEGERIDPRTKKIYDFDTSWFNLGCAGHTFMKMYLMGHVAAAISLGYVTTLDERRTIMKMFAADYCGTGYAFTVPGVPLQWQDDKHWVHYLSLAGLHVEARWTPAGAACLEVPRVRANSTPESTATWPLGIEREISARCPGLPRGTCNPDIQAFDGYHMVTANP
jgi:hypothetical protein